jgi:hypothetical protein
MPSAPTAQRAVRSADEAPCRRLTGSLPVHVGDQRLHIVGAAEVEGDQHGRVRLPIAVQIADADIAGLRLGVGGLLQLTNVAGERVCKYHVSGPLSAAPLLTGGGRSGSIDRLRWSTLPHGPGSLRCGGRQRRNRPF